MNLCIWMGKITFKKEQLTQSQDFNFRLPFVIIKDTINTFFSLLITLKTIKRKKTTEFKQASPIKSIHLYFHNHS